MKKPLCWFCLIILLFAAPAGASEPGPQYEAVEMDEIVVTATRRETLLSDVPDVLLVITRREIDELNPSSTGELLAYITGTSVETGTGSGLPKRHIVGLNGLPANYTLVLVDGVRLLSEHIHTGRNLELIPPHVIERIEVIRGAASAQYGADAIGGVINIITRKCGDETETSLGGAAGMYDSYEAGAAWLRPVTDDVRLSLFVNREWSKGAPVKEPAHRVGNMGYEQFNLLTRLDFDLTETSTAFGWLNWVNSTMDWRGEESDSELLTGVLGLSHSFAETVSLSTRVSYSSWEAERSGETNELLQPEGYITWHINDANTVTAGMDFKDHTFTRTAVIESDQDTIGAFIQHEWSPIDSLTFMAALRYDDVEDVEAVFSPKATILYSPDLPLCLRGSISRGFHEPTPQELYEEGYGHGGQALRFGNPDLEPEYSTTYGLGLELFPGRPFQLMLYGHYSDIDDMIVPVYEGPWYDDPTLDPDEEPTKDIWRRTNIERARVYGGEVKARYSCSRNLRFEGGYSYTDNKETDTGRQLPYNPGSTLFIKAVGAHQFAPDWTCSGFVGLQAAFDRSAWSWKPAEGAPEDDPTGLTTELDDYQNLNAGLSLSYRDMYRVYLNAYNILGQDIENLDDLFTVIDGEPVVKGGFRCDW
ncbi:TonB-dependent receptor plug domain-containing protein [Thermodesulfobacteriota bacterium]